MFRKSIWHTTAGTHFKDPNSGKITLIFPGTWVSITPFNLLSLKGCPIPQDVPCCSGGGPVRRDGATFSSMRRRSSVRESPAPCWLYSLRCFWRRAWCSFWCRWIRVGVLDFPLGMPKFSIPHFARSIWLMIGNKAIKQFLFHELLSEKGTLGGWRPIQTSSLGCKK